MQESMMIAAVGDMEKVSGRRIATPLAPPNPGSTPMMTPSTMPTNISSRLNGWMTTAKPWKRSTKLPIFLRFLARFSIAEQRFDGTLGQRDEEPVLEEEEDHERHAD